MYGLLQSLPYGFRAQLKILFSLSHLQNVLYFLKKCGTSVFNKIKGGANFDIVFMMQHMSQIKASKGENVEDNVVRYAYSGHFYSVQS